MQHEAYFAALALTPRQLFDAVPAVREALVILRKPPLALETASLPQVWQAWLEHDAPCPVEMLHTVTGEWQHPAPAGCYGWIVNAKTQIRPCAKSAVEVAYAVMTDKQAANWRKQVPQPYEFARQLAHVSDEAGITTEFYHASAKASRLRAAVPISKGTLIPVGAVPMYAHDARGIHDANVGIDRRTLRDIRAGQPLILAGSDDADARPAKRARIDHCELNLCFLGAQRRLQVVQPCPGGSVELPLETAEALDTLPLFSHSIFVQSIQPGCLSIKQSSPGYRVELLLADGTIKSMALSIAKRSHARLLAVQGYRGAAKQIFPVGSPPPYSAFVGPAPTNCDIPNVVLAEVKNVNGAFVLSVPLDKVGIVYSKSPQAAEHDELRRQCVPQRFAFRHTMYSERESSICMMKNADAMAILNHHRSAPHIVDSHMCLPSTLSVPPLPLRLGPKCYLETGLCADLMSTADVFLKTVTEPWGAYEALTLSDVRVDVDSATGMTDFPSNRARQLWLKARASPTATAYAMLGYVFCEGIGRQCAAVAIGHVGETFIEKRAGADGPFWPVCILKILISGQNDK